MFCPRTPGVRRVPTCFVPEPLFCISLLLSPTLSHIFLKRIINDPLENHEGKRSEGGASITNLLFYDDIDGNFGKAGTLVQSLD